MSSISVSLDGFDKLEAKLKALGGLTAELRKDAVTALMPVRNAARRHAPGDGKLKASIVVKDNSTDKDLKVSCGIFADSQINYPVFVEFGTGIYAENGQGRKDPWIAPMIIDGDRIFRWTQGMHPHPFMRPAWDEEKDNVEKLMRDAIIKRINDLALKAVSK